MKSADDSGKEPLVVARFCMKVVNSRAVWKTVTGLLVNIPSTGRVGGSSGVDIRSVGAVFYMLRVAQ